MLSTIPLEIIHVDMKALYIVEILTFRLLHVQYFLLFKKFLGS